GACWRHRMGSAFHAGQEAPQAGPASIKTGGAGPDAFGPHESLYPAPADLFALTPQGCVNARAAVGAAAVVMDCADLVGKHGILNGTLACRAGYPSVEACRADPEHSAHRPHRVRFLVVLDEGEDVAFRAEVNAMA